MDDIEDLLKGVAFPSPSAELDARIFELTRKPLRCEKLGDRLRQILVLVSSTACAGLFGFALGQRSVSQSPMKQFDAAPLVVNSDAVKAASKNKRVIVYEPPNEALARFVIPGKRVEGLFGSGPLEERSGPSQLE